MISETKKELLKTIKETTESSLLSEKKLKKTVQVLKNKVEYYDWVGFYLVKGSRSLVLGPFCGDPTDHVEIDFGQGICGQAAEKGENFLIQDVSAEENYLSCSPEVDSEIVVPIFFRGELIGEIDIDSHQLSPFDGEDEEFLEETAEILSETVYEYLKEEVRSK